ncbi:MAG: sulfurtransferase [Gammaproteobacteria bacterium]|nr:sulfurtransferase [Gammaproteobacteria bacterium]
MNPGASPASPTVIEAADLAARLPDDELLIVDVGAAETYRKAHLPGAVHLDYARLILGRPPAPGLMPPPAQLEAALRGIGLAANKHVIAYDDSGNGRASRLLWTLEALGHAKFSLLNGGLIAWLGEGCATETTVNEAAPGDFTARPNPAVVADKQFVLAALDDHRFQLLDARTPEEYHGLKSPSARSGRIPGAVNLNWLDTIDRDHHLRYKPAAELEAMLAERGISRDKEIITYCQTHHRSSHAFMLLRHLGFDKVRGYPGSWSEWGNAIDLPIE